MTPKLTLTYFTIAGRAEPQRLAAVIGKVPFTNHGIAPKDWPTVKPTTPLGKMPFLEIEEEGKDKVVVAESNAILRYVGKLGGVYPSDPIQALKVDSLIETSLEATRSLEVSLSGMVRSLLFETDWTDEEKLACRKRLAEDKERGLPFYLSYFEKVLKENGTGFFVGDSLTIADLAISRLVFWIESGTLDGIPKSMLDDYPLFKALAAKIESTPEVVAYRTKHPIPYGDFDFEP